MSPSGNWIIVSLGQQNSYKDTWTTCHGVELFDRETITSQGMILSSDSHNDVGYDINGYEVMVAPHGSRLLGESGSGNWSVDVTRLSDVHPPPYGTTTATSYVRRYYMPCTFYSALKGTDPYTGCTRAAANGTNYLARLGPGGGEPSGLRSIPDFHRLPTEPQPGAEQAGFGRSGNIIATIDSKLLSQLILSTSAETLAGNVLHFASTVPPSGLYGLLAGGQRYVSGTHIADNTTVTSFDSTSVTLSNAVTGAISSGASITFFMRLPFHLAGRTVASRYGNALPQCTGGDDYWQEPHATVNRTFTQILFASSWLSQCGQVGAFYVNLPGYQQVSPGTQDRRPPRNHNHVVTQHTRDTYVRRP